MLLAAGVAALVLVLILASAAHDAEAAPPARESSRELVPARATPASRARVLLASPWGDVERSAWTRWVAVMGNPRADLVSPGGNLGMFQLSLARLADLGYVTNLRKVRSSGASTTLADWNPPLSQEQFLHDRHTQYSAFVRAVKADRSRIERLHPGAVGQEMAGVKATLSGLLAAMKQAGSAGFDRWLEAADAEARFPATTANFRRGNELF